MRLFARKKYSIFFGILGIFLLAVFPLISQDLPFDPEVRIGVLPNGLRYYIKYNDKPENRAELRLAVKAGSLQEDPDQLGIAHFVEHMAFNGTRNFEKNELINYLERTGTRFGADLNAYTSFAETVYMLQVRTDSLDLLEKGVLILEDWAGGVLFEQEEVDKERGVVISEWRTRLSPDQRLQQKYYPVLYQDSRYAERLPIGDPEIIKNADYPTIKRFYKDWYRPELMAVVAVGDFDINWMEQQIRRRFSGLKNPVQPRTREQYKLPLHKGTRSIIATDTEAPFINVRLNIKSPASKLETKTDYRNQLARVLYNRMLSARLYELQQTQNPAFTFASSYFGSNLGETDAYTVYVFTGEGKALAGFRSVYIETIRALQHGFTEGELERAKKELMVSAERNFKERETQKSNQLVSGLAAHFLRDSPFLTPGQTLDLYQELLPGISLEAINPLPKQWLGQNNRTLVVTGPENMRSSLPDKTAFLNLIDSIENAKLEPYLDVVSEAPLFDQILSPMPIQNETYHEEFDITELTLANGARVVLKPTTFKEDEIRMLSFSPGGHSLASDAIYQSATAATTIADLSGLGNFSSTALQKKLTGITASAGPYISELYEGLNGSCSPDDLETMLQLVYLYVTAPRFDQQSLDGYKQRQANVWENIAVNPYYYFGIQQAKIRYQNHPRRTAIISIEELESIDLEEARAFYRERFQDLGDITFLMVGNFTVDSIKTLLATYLGNLPANGRTEQFKDVNARLAEGVIDTVIVRGKAPKSIVDITFHGSFDYRPQNRYEFNSMLSVLQIQLRERLREDLGGVYGVNVSGFNAQYPYPFYRIGISFNAEPEMVDTLVQTAFASIRNLQQKGPDDADIEKVRETQRQSRIKAEKENSYWMAQLQYRFQQNIPLEGMRRSVFEKRLEGLSRKTVQAAAQQYFNFDQYIKLVLMPEE